MFHLPINLSSQSALQMPICGNGISPFLRMPGVSVRQVNGNLGSTTISNITNSSDPDAICARLFVGNLNTLDLSKEAVEAIFSRYGEIVGISMHKGYAFIQYGKETDARKAVTGENHRVYAGRQIDVNLAAEPRKNPRRKRFYEAITNGSSLRHDVNQGFRSKRPRDSGISSRQFLVETDENRLSVSHPGTNDVTRAKPSEHRPFINGDRPDICDILICGNCKQLFTHLGSFIDHKQRGCSSPTHCQCRGKRTRSTTTDLSDEDMSAPSTYSECGKNTEWDRVSSPKSHINRLAEEHDGDPSHEQHPAANLSNCPVSLADNGHVTSLPLGSQSSPPGCNGACCDDVTDTQNITKTKYAGDI